MASLKTYQVAFAKAEEACLRAAQGDLEARIVGIEEVGELAGCLNAINRLLDLTDAYVRESSASLEYASQRKYYRPFLLRGMRGDFRRGAAVINAARESMKRRHELTEEFQAAVAEVVGIFSTAAGELEGTAKSMSATAESTHERSLAVAAASEQTASNAQSVAAGTEELAAAIAEIGRQVNDSTVGTGTAVEETRRATSAVQGLIEAAAQIGRVVAFIRDIAKQTNLLALNATIEAARAGEAGRGFAVVAHEVKTLAGQVAEATSDITQQVEAMQGASDLTASTIQNIDKQIAGVAEVATAIASAVEQQSAATAEISDNVQQAAAGSQTVSGNIAGITAASQETGETARSLLDSAAQLSKEAGDLRLRVQDFLEKIEAA